MSFEVKRVAADFTWPIDTTWKGYLNPHEDASHNCPTCDGSGATPEGHLYYQQWYGQEPFDPVEYGSQPIAPDRPAMVAAVTSKIEWNEKSDLDGARYYTHGGRIPLSQAIRSECLRMCALVNSYWSHHLNQADINALVEAGAIDKVTEHFGGIPTLEQWQDFMLAGIPGEPHWGFNDMGPAIEARCERNGVGHTCPTCDGSGLEWVSLEAKLEYESWKPQGPPAGESWMLWETVSEGSPISPTFATAEELAKWLSRERRWNMKKRQSAEKWLKFLIGPGGSCSAVVTSDGEVMDGTDFAMEEDDG